MSDRARLVGEMLADWHALNSTNLISESWIRDWAKR